ncbi:2'-5' RNA ligase family protein [Micromonospora sp. NPDC000207]|uniref:2'-5' RNA ligase family protein n=1 Tax=Micromonospora sp. NPDC000207 TaxID=3154246 RepID=UPI00331E53CF
MSIEHVEAMQDHWWWRPGWRVGRRFYACHFELGAQSALVDLVARWQVVLRDFSGLDLIPGRWLHLTTEGIGFVDEVGSDEVVELRQQLSVRLAALSTPVVTFHRPVVRPEAVYLPATPVESIEAVRSTIRDVVTEVLGDDRVEATPAQFRPHVSIAYSNTGQPSRPIAEALSRVDVDPVTVALDRIGFLEFHRDYRMYEWTTVERLGIGCCSKWSRDAARG